MFERFTERARRVIFFARYEASQFGSVTIESAHFLLGLLREDKNLPGRYAANPLSAESLREDVTRRLTVQEKVATSVDLPLSPECKRILAYAAEEAERLNHPFIGTEHLLLGILREEKCLAAQVLFERGLSVDAIREKMVRDPVPQEPETATYSPRPLFPFLQHHPSLPESGVVPDAGTAKRIAEAIWFALYGAETVDRETLLKAELKFNVWLVTGPEAPGGTMFAYILQADGRILSVGRGPTNTAS